MNIRSSYNKIIGTIRNLLKTGFTTLNGFLVPLLVYVSKYQTAFCAILARIVATNHATPQELHIFTGFVVFYILMTILHANTKRYPKLFKVTRVILNICSFLCICVLTLFLSKTICYLFAHRNTLLNVAKAYLAPGPSKWRFALNYLKFLSVPLGTMYLLYSKISRYCNMSNYSTRSKLNVITGEVIKDSVYQGLRIPYFDIFLSIFLFRNEQGVVGFLLKMIDLMIGFSNFTGHKSSNILLETVITCIVTVIRMGVTYANMIKNVSPITVSN